MINAYHLSDAIPAALFGMFALWAAASKRHWFIRTAVVAAALIITLFIPAFEVVIEFGVECLLVVAGLAIWKRRRAAEGSTPPPNQLRVRLSLESLLLLVVIVAVATTVAARAPRLAAIQWYQLLVTGIVAAAVGLASVWIVSGQARWWIRLLAAPLLAFTFGVVKVCLAWTGAILNYWLVLRLPNFSDYFQHAMRDLWPSIVYWVVAIALGMAVICAWLFLLRRAGWFDPFGEFTAEPGANRSSQRELIIARCSTLALFGLVSVFPLTLLYGLLTPTPIPAVTLPDPNGFNDFVAAGQMFSAADAANLELCHQLSNARLATLLLPYAPAFDRAQLGLQKACATPHPFQFSTPPDEVDVFHLLSALGARGVLADRTGTVEQRVAAYWDMLRVSVQGDRGAGANFSMPAQCESSATYGLWNCREQLSSQQCADLAAKVWTLESGREPWSIRAARQRIIDDNINWQSHLQSILASWSGKDRHPSERQFYLRRQTELRTLTLELAIRAYQIDSGWPPKKLADLVPKYLPAVPDDPFVSGPMKYRLVDDGYTIYSVGPDGIDDGGKPIDAASGSDKGDYTADELFPKPVPSQPASTNAP